MKGFASFSFVVAGCAGMRLDQAVLSPRHTRTKLGRMFIAVCVMLNFNANASQIHFSPEMAYESRNITVGEEPGMWCAHPTDPNQLIGITSAPETASLSGNFIQQNYIVRRSKDGGRTWKETLRTSAAPREADPACAYGPDGEVFVSAMTNFGTRFDGASIWRSTDGGQTWEKPSRIEHARFFDRPFLAVDRGATAHHGRLYVVGWGKSLTGDALQRPDEIVVYTSDDGGKHFNPPAYIPTKSAQGRDGIVHLGEPTVLPDGTYIVSWAELDMELDSTTGAGLASQGTGTSMIKIARSIDGGRSFEPPIEVAKARWKMELNGRRFTVSKYYPSIAVDNTEGPFRNTIYAAWADATEGRQQIAFSRSSDGGKTWTSPSIVSDGHAFDSSEPARGPHNKMVVLRVNKNGVLGAFYYAQSTPDPDVQFWPVFTASLDGGTTWLPPEHVLKTPVYYGAMNLNWDCWRYLDRQGNALPLLCMFPARTSVPNCLYGLTTSADGDFRIFAFSDPNGQPTYTMRNASIQGNVTRREEVAADVNVNMQTISYDPKTQIVIARAVITNVGTHDLGLPIRLVVNNAGNNPTLEQKIEILNSDNARETAGAWWDFKSTSSGRTLFSGQRTEPRMLKFQFAGKFKTSISSAQGMLLYLKVYATEI
ncbi:MAG: sialidase family protein [Rudaea sp.]|uniref:sialidase family protein n=1 Tax=Rudaea sp. TaxID=2136325 RepID=UPI0039E5F7B3